MRYQGISYNRSTLLFIAAAVFLLFVAGLVFANRLPLAVLGLYLTASVAAFVMYAFDKSAARRDKWRIQENTLHLLALVGGWPGALVAQKLLRHKSSKTSFQFVFWVTVFINCCALAWLIFSSAASTLRSVLGAG